MRSIYKSGRMLLPMRDADEPSLDELLMGAARALRRRWATGLGPDLSPHDARALRVIGHHGPTRLGVVADHLRIAPRSATDVVDRLESRGLVHRSPDPADRRAMTVSLTEVGESVLAEVDEARREGAADFFGALSDRERASLATILGRLDPREPREG
jgi:DNA-binding MarR family transcriptional regulator